MLMLRTPVSDATMARLPKGATKHPWATASAGSATFFSRELLRGADEGGRLEALVMPPAGERDDWKGGAGCSCGLLACGTVQIHCAIK